MARVPTLDAPSVSPIGASMPYQTMQATPSAFGGQIGTAEQQAGQTLEQSGNVLADAALRQQQIDNETAVNDAYANKFVPAFSDQYQQYYRL